MSQDTKNDLSVPQLDALRETRFFDLKREVTHFISQQFAALQACLREEWLRFPQAHPAELPRAKISKGEQYLGYPYVNLDYPRQFSRERVFAFRSLLWWGHHFSFTLHLQGTVLDAVSGREERLQQELAGKGYWWCVNRQPWDYHYGKDNYRPLDALPAESLSRQLTERGFVKLSRKLELENYRDVVPFGTGTFREILEAVYG
jgi:hypothetical protein